MSRRAVSTGDELQFVVFRVGLRALSVSIVQVERILRYETPEPWSGPPFLEGRIPFGGGRVPLLDLRRRLGLDPAPREETRVMVLAVERLSLALVVDQVNEVVRVDTRTIRPPGDPVPGFPPEAAGGFFDRPDGPIPILNAARLLTGAERQALAEALT